ncbi:MAG: zf-HC2 domain-containing protein [Planctomycetes bacterium]|nr:zf-HC2 domain-containing protein [Planctomycetota bacterium]
MECKYSEKLESYFDGDLGPAEGSGVKAHLESCGECRQKIEFYSKMRESLRKGNFRLREGFAGKVAKKAMAGSFMQRYRNIFAAAAAILLVVSATLWIGPTLFHRHYHRAPVSRPAVATMEINVAMPPQVADLKNTSKMLMDNFLGYLKAPYNITMDELSLGSKDSNGNNRSENGNMLEELEGLWNSIEKM